MDFHICKHDALDFEKRPIFVEISRYRIAAERRLLDTRLTGQTSSIASCIMKYHQNIKKWKLFQYEQTGKKKKSLSFRFSISRTVSRTFFGGSRLERRYEFINRQTCFFSLSLSVSRFFFHCIIPSSHQRRLSFFFFLFVFLKKREIFPVRCISFSLFFPLLDMMTSARLSCHYVAFFVMPSSIPTLSPFSPSVCRGTDTSLFLSQSSHSIIFFIGHRYSECISTIFQKKKCSKHTIEYTDNHPNYSHLSFTFFQTILLRLQPPPDNIVVGIRDYESVTHRWLLHIRINRVGHVPALGSLGYTCWPALRR